MAQLETSHLLAKLEKIIQSKAQKLKVYQNRPDANKSYIASELTEIQELARIYNGIESEVTSFGIANVILQEINKLKSNAPQLGRIIIEYQISNDLENINNVGRFALKEN